MPARRAAPAALPPLSLSPRRAAARCGGGGVGMRTRETGHPPGAVRRRLFAGAANL